MSSEKEKILQLLSEQPETVSYDEILYQLLLNRLNLQPQQTINTELLEKGIQLQNLILENRKIELDSYIKSQELEFKKQTDIKLFSPKNITFFVAIVAALGTVGAAFTQGFFNLALKKQEFNFNSQLKANEFQSNLISKATEIKNEQNRREVLEFYVDIGLITDQKLAENITNYIKEKGTLPYTPPLTSNLELFSDTPPEWGLNHVPTILEACNSLGVTELKQIALILAIAEFESAAGKFMTELSSGEIYEGRKDLGNEQPGDGARFKGRGYLQMVGRRNYELLGEKLGIDLVNNPDLAAQTEVAAKILVLSLKDGLFTGVTLSDALKDSSFAQAYQRLNRGSLRPSTAQTIAARANIYLRILEDNKELSHQ